MGAFPLCCSLFQYSWSETVYFNVYVTLGDVLNSPIQSLCL